MQQTMGVMLAHQLHESKILESFGAHIDGNYLLVDELVVFFPSDSAMRPALQKTNNRLTVTS